MTQIGKLLTSREVARKYGVDIREVLYATRRGYLKGKKIGWIWTYQEDSLPKNWPTQRRSQKGKESDIE